METLRLTYEVMPDPDTFSVHYDACCPSGEYKIAFSSFQAKRRIQRRLRNPYGQVFNDWKSLYLFCKRNMRMSGDIIGDVGNAAYGAELVSSILTTLNIEWV